MTDQEILIDWYERMIRVCQKNYKRLKNPARKRNELEIIERLETKLQELKNRKQCQ